MDDRRHDTIAALATAAGRGAVAIVRLSGTECALDRPALTRRRAAAALRASCARFATPSRRAARSRPGASFPAPRSYTGEDVVELHGHGGRVVSDALLAHAFALGARPAEPGEFTLRAFLNDKVDLLQAEAVADLVGEWLCARRARSAALARRRILERRRRRAAGLTALRVRIEAWLDFPEEELDFAGRSEARPRSTRCSRSSTRLGAARGVRAECCATA